MAFDKTPCATLHTPSGSGGIAVVVLAGYGAGRILSTIFRPLNKGENAHLPAPGRISLGDLLDNDSRLDEAVIACRKKDCYEINIHGGVHVSRRLLELLTDCGAKVGEIKDFDSGEVFECEYKSLNNPAIGREFFKLAGFVSSPRLLECLSCQWTGGLSKQASDLLDNLQNGQFDNDEVQKVVREMAAGFSEVEQLFKNPSVVFAGAPNAGKTSLVNALASREVGIVSSHAGTTRDWLETEVDFDGFTLKLVDTAGLFDSEHVLDCHSVALAHQRISESECLVAVFDAGCADSRSDEHFKKLLQDNPGTIVAAAKADLAEFSQVNPDDIAVSAADGTGLARLCATILAKLGLDDFDPAVPRAFTLHQRDLLLQTAENIESGDISAAVQALKSLLGRT